VDIPALAWLITIPLLSSPVIYLLGHKSSGLDSGRGWQATARWFALITLTVTFFPFLHATQVLSLNGPSVFTIGMVNLRMDGLGLLMAGTVLVLATMVALFSGPYMAGEASEEKFYAMLMTMVGATIGLASAGDLFNLWVWFETMAVSSYLLVAFYRGRPTSLEAAVKYLVQSAVGSVLVLLGIALVLMHTGMLDLEQIRAHADASPVLLAAGALFLTGFGVKAALVPFHTWLPDAHAQAPSGVSAMLSGVVIEAGLVAMSRTLASLAGAILPWGVLLMGFGTLNMFVGNLMALCQQQVKRLLAFSSLSHVGYMLLGLGIGIYADQLPGTQGAVFHLVNHGLMKGLAFMAAGALLYALHLASGDYGPLTIADLYGAAHRYPVAALALSVAVLGLGGLPPLAGFVSEWQIFVAGFATGNGAVEGLVVFMALMSVLSLGYYTPLVNAVYRKGMSKAVKSGKPLPGIMLLPLVLMALAVVTIGLRPSLLEWLTAPAATALLAAFGG
jgi:proton-translocating NADH-quinone oxidoreductase chain N